MSNFTATDEHKTGAMYLRATRSNDKSVTDQEQHCRERAAQEGIVVQQWTAFSDEGHLGSLAIGIRPGFKSLLEHARSPSRTFDVLFIDEPSRFSRSIAEVLKTFSTLSKLGLTIFIASPESKRDLSRGRADAISTLASSS